MPRLGAGCQSDGGQFALQLCLVDHQSLTEPEPWLPRSDEIIYFILYIVDI